jgi:hypothetical protein
MTDGTQGWFSFGVQSPFSSQKSPLGQAEPVSHPALRVARSEQPREKEEDNKSEMVT